MRWIVELKNGELEDVGAHRVAITYGGTLVFQDEDEQLAIAYAPGTWRTVCPEAGE